MKKYFLFILLTTLGFLLAIAFDVSPYLRGPAPYPPDWRWEYHFVNTFSKVYLPILTGGIIIGLFWMLETKKIIIKKIKILLLILIVLSFIFQLSVLYFSRSDISVLIHRIINPELNSYFTASLLVEDPADFLKNYDHYLSQFVYHARSHPPGAVLIFYGIKQVIAPFTFFVDFANSLNPTHTDVKQIWNTLLPINKALAIFSAFFLPFLSTITLIPIFKTAKRLYGEKIALRSSFIFVFIPSIVLFIPIHDVFLPLFSVSAFYFLVKGLQENHTLSFLFSGLILFVGVTFNLALLPLLVLFFIFAFIFIRNNNKPILNHMKEATYFAVGFFLPPLLLYIIFNFNFIWLIQTIMDEVVHVHTRSYTVWLFYNLYDFFVFAGIPVAIIFITQIKQLFAIRHKPYAKDLLFISFLITLLVVDLSGSTRGETGRIWAPYLPFLILPAVTFLTNKMKFSSKLFAGILILQAMQILTLQEFWVMLW